MRLGTPQFVGGRLTEAREARAMKAITLASLIGVSRQAVSLYENGHRTPAPDMLQNISDVLKVPYQRFLIPMNGSGEQTYFWRSMSRSTVSARQRAHRMLDWLVQLVEIIDHRVCLPAVNFPEFKLPDSPEMIGDDDIENLASETRSFWGLGNRPISNIAWLLENNGAIVVRQDLAVDSLDAFSIWNSSDQRPYFVLGSHKATAVRSRFNISHELAHCVLHRNFGEHYIRKSDSFKLLEKQANQFASAFLLPAESFSDDVHTVSLNAFRALKPKWNVSIAAMIERSFQLDLISQDERRRLWMSYNRRGWRRAEPLDDTIEHEIPQIIKQSTDLLIESNANVLEELEALMSLRKADIEEVAGLGLGYFKETGSESLRLKSSDAIIDDSFDDGVLFRFPDLLKG